MVDPFDPLVVYINFASERECTEFGAALAPHMGPALTVGKGTFNPVFNESMLPRKPVSTAGHGPFVSVFFYARAGTVIPPEVRVDHKITNGVKVCAGNVPLSAITINDCENGEGVFNITIGTNLFSLSTNPLHHLSTTYAIDCLGQWQSAVQRDKQALENWVNDCKAMREHFLLHGKYLTTLPNSGCTRPLAPGQEPVLYRSPASAPAPAQVVPLPVVSKISKGSVHGHRTMSWGDDDVVETTGSPAKPVMSEMELLMKETAELEASNKEVEASIESAIEAQKVAEAKKAEEEALIAMRLKRDALVAKQMQLRATQATQATLLSA